MVTVRDYDKLTNHYKSEYTKKYGSAPFINRQSASWLWKSIIQDFTMEEIKDLITFFFEHYLHRDHDFSWFNYNYEKVAEAKSERDKEAKHINDLRIESQNRIKEREATLERIKSNRRNTERE